MDNPAYSVQDDDSGPRQRVGHGAVAPHTNGTPQPQDVGPTDTATGEETVGLKKRVGLVSGTALIVGTMIGSGIFISPKGVAEGSGSVGLSLISWLICGIVALLGSLTYAELGTYITESGGEWAYLKAGYGSGAAFLFSWMNIIVLKPASMSIIALTCGEYIMVTAFRDGCGDPPSQNVKLVAAVVILLLAAVNAYSVNLATNIQVIFTAAKLLALALIIIGGFVKLGQGYTVNLASGFNNTEGNAGRIALGLYNGMWAYDGWNNLNYVTEEIINPHVNLPRSILIGIPLVTVLYMLVNISYFTVMSVPELLASPAVAVTWGEAVIPAVSWIIPVSVALSTFGAANGTLFSGGRLTYAAAREGHMLELLSMVHIKKFTPLPSLVFTTILSLIFIIPGDIGSLIDFFNFAVWIFYGLTASACIFMRFKTKYKDAPRPLKVPLVIPILVLIISVFLVIAPIVSDPRMEFLYVAIFIVGGLIFYVPFVYFKKVLPCMGAITKFFQLLMECSPPLGEPDN